jgi:putative flippase GtrA
VTDGRPDSPDRLGSLLSGIRFGKFASVGAVGAVVDIGTLVILTEGVGIPAEFATLLSIECAILTMFAINERWTYADDGAPGIGPLFRRLLRSHGVRAVGTAAHLLVFYLLLWNQFMAVTALGLDLWPVVAKGTGIASGVFFNYTFESLVTWQIHLED